MSVKELSSGLGGDIDNSLEYENDYININKYNSHGLPNCRLCGRPQEDMGKHIQDAHGISLDLYVNTNPGWPIIPLNGVSGGSLLSFRERKKKLFSVKELFGFWWDKNEKAGTDKEVQGYEVPGPLTPQIDLGYVFNAEDTSVFLLGLHVHDHILIHGPTGSGKTTLGEQIAARLNFNYMRINLDGGITRSDLVGQWLVQGKSMFFAYGMLPLGMLLPGTIICIDEWDAASEEVSGVLQRPLEKNSQLLVLEKNEEIITLHPENMIVATSNTIGMGDETGLYAHGTQIQNFSQLNRFSMTIELNYLPEEEERRILLMRFGHGSVFSQKYNKELLPVESKFMVDIVNKVRQAYMKGNLSVPLSTRDLINWCFKYMIWGDMDKAAKYCFINRMTLEDREVVRQIIRRAFEV